MKNSITIDIDTERDQPILIAKGTECHVPTNKEEAAEMVLTDITCICEAMLSLIHVADQNQYGTKENLIKHVTDKINQFSKLPTNG